MNKEKIKLQPVLTLPNTSEKTEKLHKFCVDNQIYIHYIYEEDVLKIPDMLKDLTTLKETQ